MTIPDDELQEKFLDTVKTVRPSRQIQFLLQIFRYLDKEIYCD